MARRNTRRGGEDVSIDDVAAALATITPPDRTIVPGCTVYLRPGSPRMTVLAVKDDGTADVVLNLYGTLTMRRDPLLALDFVAGPKR